MFTEPYPEVVDQLPPNFDDDLHTKPEAHRQWRWDQQHGLWGYIDPSDTEAWLRHLDYYVHLHRMADRNLGTVLAALEASGAWDDTVIIFTSDHGDMCGSHGLRSKGPFVYDEIMRVPLYVKVPGVTTPGSVTAGARIPRGPGRHHLLAGRRGPGHRRRHRPGRRPLPGARRPVDLGPRPHPVRPGLGPDHRPQRRPLRPAAASTTGTTKYARYYGVGGGKPSTGLWGKSPGHKLFDVDCSFDDNDHEWYDHDGDPHELVNLANDRSTALLSCGTPSNGCVAYEQESFVTFG